LEKKALNNKVNDAPVVLITGSSRGLGRSLAEHFLKLNFRVAGCSRGESTIDNPHYHHYSLDISDEGQIRSWVRVLKRTLGDIDVLICNAALVSSALLLAATPGNVMESFLKTNIAGVFYIVKEISKLMMIKGKGNIITISSTMVALHEEGTAIYSATKSAVTEMTKILAKELAPKGITCNVIAPAMMATDSSKALSKGGDWQKRMLDIQTIPRVLEMEEICHVADFLISPLSSAITGQVIYLGVVN
jgi:3-oxoacyl-[acyl-carrier protein] reductase